MSDDALAQQMGQLIEQNAMLLKLLGEKHLQPQASAAFPPMEEPGEGMMTTRELLAILNHPDPLFAVRAREKRIRAEEMKMRKRVTTGTRRAA